MTQLSASERALVDDVLECIAEAMNWLDDVDPAYANKTKLQKLLYLAIDEFDLPITYSWYLAGALVPGDPATPTGLQSAFDGLPIAETPPSPSVDCDRSTPSATGDDRTDDGRADDESTPIPDDEAAETDEQEDAPIDPILFSSVESVGAHPSRGGSGAATLSDRRSEVVDFYVEVIPDVWHQNTMRFLQNFYLEHAPSEYRELYVQSTHFRTRLRDVESALEAHLRGETPDRSIRELVTDAGLDVSDLHCTIRSSEHLAETFDEFVRGTDLIEDGLMMLARRSPDQLEDEHLDAVRSMQDFFYYFVWRYPCLLVSAATATGPSAETVRASRRRRFADFDAELEEEREKFERELAEVGLSPGYDDYSLEDDEVMETISALADHYFD